MVIVHPVMPLIVRFGTGLHRYDAPIGLAPIACMRLRCPGSWHFMLTPDRVRGVIASVGIFGVMPGGLIKGNADRGACIAANSLYEIFIGA